MQKLDNDGCPYGLERDTKNEGEYVRLEACDTHVRLTRDQARILAYFLLNFACTGSIHTDENWS